MNISEENLWAIEYTDLFDKQDLSKTRILLNELLDLLIYLYDILAEENVPVEEYEMMPTQLFKKFYLHGITIRNISEGYKLSTENFSIPQLSEVDYIDIASLMTVCRAQMETLLMYQHLCINDQNIDEQKLRYYSWIYTALLQRRNTPATDLNVKLQLEKDANEINRIKLEIENLDSFKMLSLKQQKGLLEIGTAKLFKNWQTIFDESGFSKETLFARLYYILSAYSHSEGLSVIQMRSSTQLLSNKENHEKVFFQIFCSMLMTSIMICNLISKYEILAKKFDEIEKKKKFTVNFFASLGKDNSTTFTK